MNNGSYLIPANTKAGELILNIFTMSDLILFGTGIGITLILLFAVPLSNLLFTIIVLAPALVTGFLVIPVPNYHNMITLIREMINYISERRIYIWKGWCFYEFDEPEKK